METTTQYLRRREYEGRTRRESWSEQDLRLLPGLKLGFAIYIGVPLFFLLFGWALSGFKLNVY